MKLINRLFTLVLIVLLLVGAFQTTKSKSLAGGVDWPDPMNPTLHLIKDNLKLIEK
ncbi:hypothetical protein [Heyndrickxia sporothermodurans]|uniref:hypothetical protein n=1 Tax=Heyndrickxia sporothermodurans TaxID=46224 RepID=UPI000B328C7F|nr:hypothetical protein [Heyndrickxia sporothermodurans]